MKIIEENSKTGQRQRQHIHGLETDIIDVWDISFGTLRACHMWKKFLKKGRGG